MLGTLNESEPRASGSGANRSETLAAPSDSRLISRYALIAYALV